VNIARWSQDWAYDGSFLSFHARLESVIKALRGSKALVSGLLGADLMIRLATHPERELKRKGSNKAQNAERDKQVKAGIEARREGVVIEAEDGTLLRRDGTVIDGARPIPAALAEITQQRSRRARGRGNLNQITSDSISDAQA
jgi:hypothetical protein